MSAARLVAAAALSAAFANACATAMADAVDVIVLRCAGVWAMPEDDARMTVHAGHPFLSSFATFFPGVGVSHPGAGCGAVSSANAGLPAHSSSLEL